MNPSILTHLIIRETQVDPSPMLTSYLANYRLTLAILSDSDLERYVAVKIIQTHFPSFVPTVMNDGKYKHAILLRCHSWNDILAIGIDHGYVMSVAAVADERDPMSTFIQGLKISMFGDRHITYDSQKPQSAILVEIESKIISTLLSYFQYLISAQTKTMNSCGFIELNRTSS